MLPAVNLLNNLFRPSATWFSRAGRERPAPHQLTRPTVQSPATLDLAEGIVTVHSACATLVKTPENMVRSINVLVPLVDFPVPPTSLVDVAERIASEYGITAQARVDERFLQVRLARSDGGTDQILEKRSGAPAKGE